MTDTHQAFWAEYHFDVLTGCNCLADYQSTTTPSPQAGPLSVGARRGYESERNAKRIHSASSRPADQTLSALHWAKERRKEVSPSTGTGTCNLSVLRSMLPAPGHPSCTCSPETVHVLLAYPSLGPERYPSLGSAFPSVSP